MASIELRRLLARAKRLAALDEYDYVEWDEVHRKIAALEIECEAIEASEQRVLVQLSAGESPGSVSSVLNAVSSETLQRADLLGVEIAAYYALPYQPGAVEIDGDPSIGPDLMLPVVPSFLNNRMRTIAGGSAEIQRNIVAKTILGL